MKSAGQEGEINERRELERGKGRRGGERRCEEEGEGNEKREGKGGGGE